MVMTNYLPILLTNWNLNTMLEIFSDVHDAMHELKDLRMNHGDGDALLGIGKALLATLKSVAQGGSSIINAIGGAIHDTLNGVRDLDEKVVGSLGEAASKVIKSAGHAVKDSTTGIGNVFHGILRWNRRYDTMVPHFSNNIGIFVHQSFYTLQAL